MDILCGIDFTEEGGHACQVAAQLASRLGDRLILAHVAEPFEATGETSDASPKQAIVDELQRRVASLQTTGIDVSAHLLEGPVERCLLELAASLGPRLLVIGSGVHRHSAASFGDSIAARLLQQTHYPVLLVGNQQNNVAQWWSHNSALRILVGLDSTPAADSALEWLKALRRDLPLRLHCVQFYYPEADAAPIDADALAVERRAQLAAQLGEPPPGDDLTVRCLAGWQDVPERLEAELREAPADLLVLGIHPRSLLDGHDAAPVLSSLLSQAARLHLCFAAQPPPPLAERRLPELQTVLAACDLAPGSHNAAVYYAYALLRGRGGRVHLCHVCRETELLAPAREALQTLIPAQASGWGVTTEVHVLHSSHAGTELAQLAESLAVDALCLGTHGRTPLSQLLSGSTASEVHQHTTKPVLLVRDDLPF